jgi:hypothetical protein
MEKKIKMNSENSGERRGGREGRKGRMVGLFCPSSKTTGEKSKKKKKRKKRREGEGPEKEGGMRAIKVIKRARTQVNLRKAHQKKEFGRLVEIHKKVM